MIFLFIHQNFPAQYRHLARHLVDAGHTVYFISQPNQNFMPGIQKLVYDPNLPAQLVCHPFAAELDSAVRIGLSVANVCRELKENGVYPDIIIGHNGWGETLFVKDIFPQIPLLAYFEFYYHFQGVDVGFDPEFAPDPIDAHRLRMRNAVNHVGFAAADWGHTATGWQRSLFPEDMQPRITAIHEGVDASKARPDPEASFKIPSSGRVLTRKDEVITYVARNLEPYRGFHCFMRALPDLLGRRPDAQVLIVGGDGVSYGRSPPPGITYRQLLLNELGDRIDLGRVHFLGMIPHETYLRVLQVSSVHVYLTYPFVLSWSFIEALAAGCVVIGSATPPVLEVLRDRVNGLVVDFFSADGLCRLIEEVLDHPDRMAALRHAARRTGEEFDLTRTLPQWLKLIERITKTTILSAPAGRTAAHAVTAPDAGSTFTFLPAPTPPAPPVVQPAPDSPGIRRTA